MKFRTSDAFVLLLILIIIGIFFVPLFYPIQKLIVTPDFGESDALLNFSVKHIVWESLQHDHIPLWTEAMGGGFPIFATGATGVFFLPNLILYKLFDAVTAYNLSIVFSLVILGWGTYIWLKLLAHSTFASFFGAMTIALSGYMIVQVPHNAIIQSLSIFPWICYFVLLQVKKNSWFITGLLAIAISEQLLVGFPQTVFITFLFALAYVIWLIQAVDHRASLICKFCVSGFLGLGMSAIQLLPAREFLGAIMNGNGFSLSDATYFSYPLTHLKTLLDPFLLGNPKYGTYPWFNKFQGSIFWENTAYIGLIPLLLIGIALLITKKTRGSKKTIRFLSPDVLFYLGVTSVAFLLMTGSHSPLYFLFSFWPFNIFRVPSRFIWLFIVGLILLSVNAFDYIKTTLKAKALVTPLCVCIIAFNTIQIFGTWRNYHAIEPARIWLAKPTLAQHVPAHQIVYSVGAGKVHNDIFLSKGWQSMKPYLALNNTLTPDRSVLWGVANEDQYLGRVLNRSYIENVYLSHAITASTEDATVSANGNPFLNIFAISKIVSSLPLNTPDFPKIATTSFANGSISLYTNPHAAPRLYLATMPFLATTAEDAATAIINASFIPGSSVIVEKPVRLSGTGKIGTLTMNKWTDDEVAVTVKENKREAILVYADTYFPGWKGTVDGKSTPVFPVNINQKGITVPAGDHTVRFYYAPDSLRIGMIISVLSLFATITVMVFAHFLLL